MIYKPKKKIKSKSCTSHPEIPPKKNLRKPKSSERVEAITNLDFNGVYNLKLGFQHRRRRVEANEA